MTFEERMLERFYAGLSVYQVERSRIIVIEFRSENPVLAAEIANAVAERLLQFQRAAKQEAMRQAGQWLAREIEQLRGRVSDAEARAEEFRGKSNLYVGSNNNTLSAQQLGEINSQIVLARTQRVEAESKAKMIREMLRAGGAIEASDVVNSELIRRLNEQRVTLKAQLAEQSSTLLDQHPRIKELKAQISDLEAQTRAEAMKLARSLENDAKMIGSRVEELSANLDQAKKQASALGAEDVQLHALEREAKSQRDLLESYLARYRDVTARENPDAVLPDARIVSQAVPSPTPYFPKKLPIILIAMLATMISAVTFIALAELLSSDMRRRGSDVRDEDLPTELAAEAPPSWIAGASSVASSREPPMQAQERRLAAIADHIQALGRGLIVVTPADDDGPVSGSGARTRARTGATGRPRPAAEFRHRSQRVGGAFAGRAAAGIGRSVVRRCAFQRGHSTGPLLAHPCDSGRAGNSGYGGAASRRAPRHRTRCAFADLRSRDCGGAGTHAHARSLAARPLHSRRAAGRGARP
jgi:polysaccharide biosynthesis transport protein